MPTPHAILEQIVQKMPPWAKKHMQEHPSKYPSVPQLWVALKEEEASYMTRQLTGTIPVLPTIPHDRETRTSILTMAEAILAEEAEHADAASPIAIGSEDASAPMSLGLHFLGQQFPRGPNGKFECMRCGDDHWYRKCNAPASLEELAGQHASTWPRVTPVVGNMPGAPPITPASSKSSVVSVRTPYRVTGLEREPSPAPSLSPPLLPLGATPSAGPPVSDSIIIEGPGVTVPLDYVPAGIYQGRRVWSVPVPEEDS
jgi:hypothetical protein